MDQFKTMIGFPILKVRRRNRYPFLGIIPGFLQATLVLLGMPVAFQYSLVNLSPHFSSKLLQMCPTMNLMYRLKKFHRFLFYFMLSLLYHQYSSKPWINDLASLDSKLQAGISQFPLTNCLFLVKSGVANQVVGSTCLSKYRIA